MRMRPRRTPRSGKPAAHPDAMARATGARDNVRVDQIEFPDDGRLRIATIEDDRLLRDEIVALLGAVADFVVIGAYAAAEDALDVLPALAPHVVLMDIGLPGMSGIEAARRLKAALPRAQIVMLTSFDDPRRIFEALRAGATGYVLKRAPAAEIVAAIRDVHAGGAPMSSSIARCVVQQFAEKPAAPVSELAALTAREREVLDALCEGRQYAEIGDWLGMSLNTVRKHVRNVYEKLQVNSRLEAIRKVESV